VFRTTKAHIETVKNNLKQSKKLYVQFFNACAAWKLKVLIFRYCNIICSGSNSTISARQLTKFVCQSICVCFKVQGVLETQHSTQERDMLSATLQTSISLKKHCTKSAFSKLNEKIIIKGIDNNKHFLRVLHAHMYAWVALAGSMIYVSQYLQ
jgi:hypothetical protein